VEKILARIRQYEEQIEKALQSLELSGKLDEALEAYRAVEVKLEALGIAPGHPANAEKQGALAYCLMRQGNILRQMGEAEQALRLSEREIEAARASGDELTLARSLMSSGTNLVVSGEVGLGLGQIEEAGHLFEKGEGYDFRQGLGWYWILQADLGNAGLTSRQPVEIVEAAGKALEILLPLKNWPGVVRAYAARAQAYERLGEDVAAAADREAREEIERVEMKEAGQ